MFKNISLPVRKKQKIKLQEKSFSNFKLLPFFSQATLWTFGSLFLQDAPKVQHQASHCIITISWFSSYQLNSNLFLCIINTSWFFTIIWFSFVFFHFADTSKFSVLRKERMHKTKTTEYYNRLKPTENESKLKICLAYVWKNVKKTFLIFLIFSAAWKVNLRTSIYIFYKSTAPANINYAAFGTSVKKSAFCGKQIGLFCSRRQHLHPSLETQNLMIRYW